MIDDRAEQAAAMDRARRNAAAGLGLDTRTQDRIAARRRTHGDDAADRLGDAYRRLSEAKRRRTSPEQALQLLARHEADQADQREHAEINGLEHDPSTFGE